MVSVSLKSRLAKIETMEQPNYSLTFIGLYGDMPRLFTRTKKHSTSRHEDRLMLWSIEFYYTNPLFVFDESIGDYVRYRLSVAERKAIFEMDFGVSEMKGLRVVDSTGHTLTKQEYNEERRLKGERFLEKYPEYFEREYQPPAAE